MTQPPRPPEQPEAGNGVPTPSSWPNQSWPDQAWGGGWPPTGGPTTPWQATGTPQGYGPGSSLGYQPVSASDPRRPIGAPPPAPLSIDDYKLKQSKAPWIIASVVALLLVGLLWFGSHTNQSAASSASQSSSVATAPSGFNPSGNGVPFHSDFDNADGYWEITSSDWTSQGLELNVRIAVTTGTLHFSIFAYDDTTLQDYDPVRTSLSDALNTGTVQQGSTVSGVVIFAKPRGDTSVMLADLRGDPITDLGVKG